MSSVRRPAIPHFRAIGSLMTLNKMYINTPKIKQTRKLVAFRPVVNTFSASNRQVYEASEQFLAHIIMHMLIMRIIPIIMLLVRKLRI